jgi:hypothetical protein
VTVLEKVSRIEHVLYQAAARFGHMWHTNLYLSQI